MLNDEYALFAASLRYAVIQKLVTEHALYMAVIDFDDAPDLFKSVCAQSLIHTFSCR
jgi:hypothetical protein